MQELTVKQISEKLGYDVKIVKEKPPEVFYKVGDWFKRKDGSFVRLLRTDGYKGKFKVALFEAGCVEQCHYSREVDNLHKIPWEVVRTLTIWSKEMKKVNVKVEVKEIS